LCPKGVKSREGRYPDGHIKGGKKKNNKRESLPSWGGEKRRQAAMQSQNDRGRVELHRNLASGKGRGPCPLGGGGRGTLLPSRKEISMHTDAANVGGRRNEFPIRYGGGKERLISRYKRRRGRCFPPGPVEKLSEGQNAKSLQGRKERVPIFIEREKGRACSRGGKPETPSCGVRRILGNLCIRKKKEMTQITEDSHGEGKGKIREAESATEEKDALLEKSSKRTSYRGRRGGKKSRL